MATRRVALNRRARALQGGRSARGEAFHPYAMFHDTVIALVVVCVIIGLACVWYFTSGRDPEDVGWLGPLTGGRSGTTGFVPQPDWFFCFSSTSCGSSSGRRPS